jgi:hypothetical protein
MEAKEIKKSIKSQFMELSDNQRADLLRELSKQTPGLLVLSRDKIIALKAKKEAAETLLLRSMHSSAGVRPNPPPKRKRTDADDEKKKKKKKKKTESPRSVLPLPVPAAKVHAKPSPKGEGRQKKKETREELVPKPTKGFRSRTSYESAFRTWLRESLKSKKGQIFDQYSLVQELKPKNDERGSEDYFKAHSIFFELAYCEFDKQDHSGTKGYLGISDEMRQ